jgi:uncharacterized protein YdeI (YjbR/CyaY-like superfamily)
MRNSNILPTLFFESQATWEAWLADHHADTLGLWLKISKKGAVVPSVSYADALESALCYGWIDGQKAAFDDQHWLQKFTPRRLKSSWSKINCAKAEALIAAGRMRPSGLRQVELAKTDGRWAAAYESQSAIAVPLDLQDALDEHADSKAFFSMLDATNRYAILRRIQICRTPESRAARIRQYVAMLARGEKIHP